MGGEFFSYVEDEARLKPLRAKEFKRPGCFLRYFPKIGIETDPRFNYEISDIDLRFLSELPGRPISPKQFEQIIEILERENANETAVKPFDALLPALQSSGIKVEKGDLEKIYKVRFI